MPLENDKDDKERTRLSDLMYIIPAIAALIFGMEVCGQPFRDPLSKWTAVILDVICSLLALDLFPFSLFALLQQTHATIVIVCILRMLLFGMHITDIVYTVVPREA